MNSTQMEGTLLSAATCINNNCHIWHSETCRNSGHLCKCLETKPSTIILVKGCFRLQEYAVLSP